MSFVSYEQVDAILREAEAGAPDFAGLPTPSGSLGCRTVRRELSACGKPWHEPGCLCHRGWVREEPPEPTVDVAWERWEGRDRVACRSGQPGAEPVFIANHERQLKAVAAPSRELAVLAFKDAWRLRHG